MRHCGFEQSSLMLRHRSLQVPQLVHYSAIYPPGELGVHPRPYDRRVSHKTFDVTRTQCPLMECFISRLDHLLVSVPLKDLGGCSSSSPKRPIHDCTLRITLLSLMETPPHAPLPEISALPQIQEDDTLGSNSLLGPYPVGIYHSMVMSSAPIDCSPDRLVGLTDRSDRCSI